MIKNIEATRMLYDLIISSFEDVADTLKMTQENCPGNSAFMTENDFYKNAATLEFFGLYDTDLLGCIALERKSDVRYKIKYLAVRQSSRHNGYGEQLLSYSLNYIASRGATKAQLGMFKENTPLLKWYETFGFEIEKVKKYKGNIYHICYMEKKL